MSGHRSRRRGKRGEYLLRDYLRQMGWSADRVPTSGAAQGFKGDVKASKGEKQNVLFELKNHSDVFKKIYAFYDAERLKNKDDLAAFCYPGETRQCISLSTSVEAIFDGPDVYPIFNESHAHYKEFKLTVGKIARMQALLGEAHILVLKDDRKPFLFVRYR